MKTCKTNRSIKIQVLFTGVPPLPYKSKENLVGFGLRSRVCSNAFMASKRLSFKFSAQQWTVHSPLFAHVGRIARKPTPAQSLLRLPRSRPFVLSRLHSLRSFFHRFAITIRETVKRSTTAGGSFVNSLNSAGAQQSPYLCQRNNKLSVCCFPLLSSHSTSAVSGPRTGMTVK